MTDYKNLAELKKIIQKSANKVSVTGISGVALTYLLSDFLTDFNKPVLLVLPDKKVADRIFKEMTFFISGSNVPTELEKTRLYEFPPYDISPLSGLSPHREVIAKRIQALYALTYNENPVVITSLEAIFFRTLPKEALLKYLEYLEVEEDVERELILKKLELGGYQRVSIVEERGDYSIRGGVIDLFSPLSPRPIRLEFWGDRLESIREFDPISQRTKRHLKNMVLLPSLEIIIDKDNIKRARSMGKLPSHAEDSLRFPGQEAWLNHFYAQPDTLFKYMPKNSLIALFAPHRMSTVFQKVKKKHVDEVNKFHQEAAEKAVPFPDTKGLLIPYEQTVQKIERHQQLFFDVLALDPEEKDPPEIHIKGHFQLENNLELRMGGKGRVSMAPLAEQVAKWLSLRARVVLVSRAENQAVRLKEILANYDVPVDKTIQDWSELPDAPGLYICLGRLARGFLWIDAGLFVVSEDEIFGARISQARRKSKPRDKALIWSSFSQLKTGDFVVHEDHGIGRYNDLIKMEMQNKVNDFVVIEYANNSRLYIPADRVSVLQKYAGADERDPKLDQLGGRSWNIAKQSVKKSVKRIAKQLVELYALRNYRKGNAFSAPDHYFREFEATFEHEETDDQIKAIEEVLNDMMSEKPMDRLICGDVGFGKTEIAIRAAFAAVADGKQVGMIVPTTVLTEQHFQTFKKRMDPYSIRLGVLSRFKTRAQQTRTLAELRSGEIDIVIGTHRMIQKDVKFADLGLLIIDEEQRFGVKQKELLKKYRATVDVLALTATPIPRTLHMSMMGVRDLSLIETPPQDRISIKTHLSRYDESLIERAIQAELKRGGQVFFVHNRVKDINLIAEKLKQIVPSARFAVAHGQMKEKGLEDTMMRFFEKEIDVLVCTTIIESGLDISSANTIIINAADRLGLAQIYQLRGRVGRSKEKAYAYLLISDEAKLTKDAEKRLRALMEFSHLGAGIHLAMHDLKIRGGGNVLGFSQAGHISAIGYELYLKLIERTVAELKGEEWHADINPEINVAIPAYLPGDYIIDTDIRLNLYRRLSALLEKSELEAMEDEIRDRFGTPPREVVNLFGLMSIRILLRKIGASRLDVGPKTLALTFVQDIDIDPLRLVRLVEKRPDKYRFLTQDKLRINTGAIGPDENLTKIHREIEALGL
jgi:transcription-repair coupling factor (superfamily II helicase)